MRRGDGEKELGQAWVGSSTGTWCSTSITESERLRRYEGQADMFSWSCPVENHRIGRISVGRGWDLPWRKWTFPLPIITGEANFGRRQGHQRNRPEAAPVLCRTSVDCFHSSLQAVRWCLTCQGLSRTPEALSIGHPSLLLGTPCMFSGLIHFSFALLSLRVRISFYKSPFSLTPETLHSLEYLSAQEIPFPWLRD